MSWATEDEKREHFITTTHERRYAPDEIYDMQIEYLFGRGYDEDGYQHAIVRHVNVAGVVLHEQRFDHPEAVEDAFQYVEGWRESQRYTLQERFDMQYEREMEERASWR